MAQQQEQENYTEEDLFPTPKRKERPKRVEVYAETTFDGADLSRHVHIGAAQCTACLAEHFASPGQSACSSDEKG